MDELILRNGIDEQLIVYKTGLPYEGERVGETIGRAENKWHEHHAEEAAVEDALASLEARSLDFDAYRVKENETTDRNQSEKITLNSRRPGWQNKFDSDMTNWTARVVLELYKKN